MKYILRTNSILTGHQNLEHLYTFKNFPVFIGATSNDESSDIFADLSFTICKDTGMIQLDKLLQPDLIYSEYHSEALGGIWKEHHENFVNFLLKYKLKNILEIGGSNGYIAKKYLSNSPGSYWTIVEPNPHIESEKNLKVIPSLFTKDFIVGDEIDGIVHSHVFEHMYNPKEFISDISQSIHEGAYHIFSVPNLYEYMNQKFTNCMNFEHTVFLTEYFIDYLLATYGFELLEKKKFGSHSIFYATKKTSKKINFDFTSKYVEYKLLFENYIDTNKSIISHLNKKLENSECETYLFGAHVFSQYLLHQGLNTQNIYGILDNSKIKQGKRLYGTNYKIFSPEILKEKDNAIVILKAGGYQEEIKKQLEEINSDVLIWE